MRLTVQSGCFEAPHVNNKEWISCRVYWEKQYDTVSNSQYLVLTKAYAMNSTNVWDKYISMFVYVGTNGNTQLPDADLYGVYAYFDSNDAEKSGTFQLYRLNSFKNGDGAYTFPFEIPLTESNMTMRIVQSDWNSNFVSRLDNFALELAEEITADGVVHIHNGTEYKKAIALIHDGTEFKRCIPCIHNGTEFVACK